MKSLPLPRAAALMAALLVTLPTRAAAQRWSSTLEIGGASVRYADSVEVTAATLGSTFGIEGAQVRFGGAGTLSQPATAGWSTQGTLAASGFTPPAGWLSGELAGETGGSAHEDGTRTGQALVTGRAHVMGGAGGLWAGAGIGRAWDGAAWSAIRLGEVGAWCQVARATAVATITPTAVDDSLRYADLEATLRWAAARLELGASGGVRSGARLPTFGGRAKAWGSASAAAWLAPRVALVASAGTYPVDFTQGFPGGRYAALDLRFASGKRVAPGHRFDARAGERSSRALEQTARSGVAALRIEIAPGGHRMLRVYAPAAHGVEIAGDFTSWQPVRLASSGEGWWEVTLPIARGTHQMNVRVDGGAWLIPPALTTLADEFGGAVGILVIE